MRIEAIRTAAWSILVASAGVFLFLVRSVPSGSIAPRELFALTLPHQIACAALLVLFRVGAFPESWPLIGGRGRFGTVIFWFALVAFSGFWLFFYAKFIFQVV
jgi:hypothetical protein